MGLNSSKASQANFTSSMLIPISSANSFWVANWCGTNSCRGGSSRRMVTPRPSIASNIPSKSPRCMGNSLSSAWRRPSSSFDRIISRMALIRSPSKNMCSVRHNPIPFAPNLRATAASRGVSALVRTSTRVYFSAKFIMAAKSPLISASTVGTCPS